MGNRRCTLFYRHIQPPTVNLPFASVKKILETSPPQINLSTDLPISLPITRFGIGVTNLYFQDPLTEEVVPFTRKHMEMSVRLGDQLPNFDLISTVGVIQDYPPQIADLYAVLEMVANTTKPLVILISDEELFLPALDLLESLLGDLSSHPCVIPYFNPVTPLIINRGTGDKMLDAIQHGLPVIYSNFSMAGMSTTHHRRRDADFVERRAIGWFGAQPAGSRRRSGDPGQPAGLLRHEDHAGFL